jgi:hypothetical protein
VLSSPAVEWNGLNSVTILRDQSEKCADASSAFLLSQDRVAWSWVVVGGSGCSGGQCVADGANPDGNLSLSVFRENL